MTMKPQGGRRGDVLKFKGQVKPKPWSHQHELEALKGRRVSLDVPHYEALVTGILLEADQFTIKMAIEARETPPETWSRRVFFKHEIVSFGEA